MQMQVHSGLLYFVKKTKLISSFAVEYIPNKIKEFINKFPGKKKYKN